MWNYAQERVNLILFSICRKQLDTRHQVMAPVMGRAYIMRERVKPRYQFENLFGGCMVNADGVRCRGKCGCVSCAKSNILAGAFLLVVFLLVSSFWQNTHPLTSQVNAHVVVWVAANDVLLYRGAQKRP